MKKKKILFIYPASYDAQGQLMNSRSAFMPFRTLPYLAALTPRNYKSVIINESLEKIDFEQEVDLVALTGMIKHIPRAIDIARKFKKRGKTTVIGGVGAFALQELVSDSHAFDSHVIGEADKLWPQALEDFESQKLKSLYCSDEPPSLNDLPPARFDLLDNSRYMRAFWDLRHAILPIETSRGCPRDCKFCLVMRYFGKKMRYRPIGDVVEEIRSQGAKIIFFTDDNIAINQARAKELFLALKPLGIKWIGQFETGIAAYPELLRLASDSGCVSALVGLESLLNENLHIMDKTQNARFSLKELIKNFKDVNIPMIASMIFGLDFDSCESIEWTVEQLIRHDIDAMLPWLLMPMPGTSCHEELTAQKRILHRNYSLYDGWHVVTQPKNMTPQELEEAYWKSLKRFYSLPVISRRFFPPNLNELPGLFCHLYFHNRTKRGLHPLCGSL